MKARSSSLSSPRRSVFGLLTASASVLGLMLLPGNLSAEKGKDAAAEEEKPASERSEVAIVPPEKRMGCVWKITDENNTIYLAGSVHLLRETDYPVSPVYQEVYDASDEIVMEIDMSDMMNPEGMLRMQQLGMYPADDSLDQHLSEETIARLQEYLGTHEAGQMIALAMPRLKPGMIFMTISSLEAMRLKARPDLGMEMVFHQKAQKDAKPSSGLETMEFQMTRFDEMTDEEIEELIVKTLDDIDEMATMIERIIAAWHEGDEAKLDALMNEDMEESAKVRELLLTERNANWIPEIEKAIKGETDVMFLVGAAHLIGKDSVIDMLRKKGYEIEKVNPSQPLEAIPESEVPAKAEPAAKKEAA